MNAPRNATEQVLAIRLAAAFLSDALVPGALRRCSRRPRRWGGYRLHVRSIRRQFAAVLDERNRLAREMHDTLIQGCVGVSTLLEAASHAQDVSPSSSHDLLDRARAEVHATVDEARLAVWNLRHGSRNGDGSCLPFRSSRSASGSMRASRSSVEVVGHPVAVGGENERSLLLLIREALQNAIRHGAPAACRSCCASIPAARRVDRRRRRRLRLVARSGGASPALRPGRHAGTRRAMPAASSISRARPAAGTQVRVKIPRARVGRRPIASVHQLEAWFPDGAGRR